MQISSVWELGFLKIIQDCLATIEVCVFGADIGRRIFYFGG